MAHKEEVYRDAHKDLIKSGTSKITYSKFRDRVHKRDQVHKKEEFEARSLRR